MRQSQASKAQSESEPQPEPNERSPGTHARTEVPSLRSRSEHSLPSTQSWELRQGPRQNPPSQRPERHSPSEPQLRPAGVLPSVVRWWRLGSKSRGTQLRVPVPGSQQNRSAGQSLSEQQLSTHTPGEERGIPSASGGAHTRLAHSSSRSQSSPGLFRSSQLPVSGEQNTSPGSAAQLAGVQSTLTHSPVVGLQTRPSVQAAPVRGAKQLAATQPAVGSHQGWDGFGQRESRGADRSGATSPAGTAAPSQSWSMASHCSGAPGFTLATPSLQSMRVSSRRQESPASSQSVVPQGV